MGLCGYNTGYLELCVDLPHTCSDPSCFPSVLISKTCNFDLVVVTCILCPYLFHK